MIDTEALAGAEQEAAAADVPDGSPLYTQEQQAQYRRAARLLRLAAISLEHLAVATDARLALSYLAGAVRFEEEGRRLAVAVGGEGAG